MSGPLKFWSCLIAAFAAVAMLLMHFRTPEEQPPVEPTPEVSTLSTDAPESHDSPGEPEEASSQVPELDQEMQSKEVAVTANPIHGEMSTWAGMYRAHMPLLLPPLSAFEASPAVERAVCNSLITATYNARNQLQGSPDPDIKKALDQALGHFAEAGKLCLQKKHPQCDMYLLFARTGLTLVEQLLAERYSEFGVPGLAEPMHGETEIGRRAVEFAKTLNP